MSDAERRRRHRRERIVAALIVCVAAAAAGGVLVWRQSEERQFRSQVDYIPRQTEITPEIALLQEYVRIDTTTPEGVARGARWVAAYLRKNGVAAELIESAPGRVNVYARLKGAAHGNALLLFNHIDVVPPGEGWEQPPFEARIVANQLYGRGAVDMKALAICQMLAMIEVARSGRRPAHDLVFLATADEETGSEYGMKWLLAHRPDVFEGVAVAIGEGGITEMMSERMTYFGIEIGGKNFVQLELAGQRDDLDRLRFALEPYLLQREPGRVHPLVRRYFREIAPTRIAFRPLLEDIDRAIREGHFWRLPTPYRDLTQDALWVAAPHRAGSEWTMLVRMANLPDTDPEKRIAWLRDLSAGYDVSVGRIDVKEGPVPLSSPDTRLYKLLAEEARRRYDVPAGTMILYRAVSDARFLRPRGIICYGVSPYPVNFYQSVRIHGANERIRLDWYLEGIAYLRSVIGTWARG